MARGLKKRRRRLDAVLKALAAAGHRVSPVATHGPGTAGEIARTSVCGGADLILVAGGDGTINEALNGMIHSDVPMGILPGGTANVLAVELGIGFHIEKATRQLADWIPRRVSAGLLQVRGISRCFVSMAGIGFDAHIVNNVHPGLKRQHGKLSYWIAGFRELGRTLDEFEARIDGRSLRCSFVLASRVRNYGGTVEIARHASLLADDFGVVVCEGSNPFRYLKYLAGVFSHTLNRMTGISFLRAENLELSNLDERPVYIQVDGEVVGRLPASVSIVPDALTLLVPPQFVG